MPNKEPVKTEQLNDTGRPNITEDQYMQWLITMQPFLQAGNTLYYAMEKTDLLGHSFSIYEKYRSKDWFSQKVDALRRTPGEMANNIVYRLLSAINTKTLEGITPSQLTREELDVIKLVAEKHRTAQPFFVTRTENAEVDPSQVGNILDTIEQSDYGTLGSEAKKQMVAHDSSVQNKGQDGSNSDVQTELPPTETPS